MDKWLGTINSFSVTICRKDESKKIVEIFEFCCIGE